MSKRKTPPSPEKVHTPASMASLPKRPNLNIVEPSVLLSSKSSSADQVRLILILMLLIGDLAADKHPFQEA